MKKIKILLFSLILIFSMSSSVFAGPFPSLSETRAEYILDYFSNPEHLVVSFTKNAVTESNINSNIEILENTNPASLVRFFDDNIDEVFKDSDLVSLSWQNVTCYGSVMSGFFRIYFAISNNTAPGNNELDYQLLTHHETADNNLVLDYELTTYPTNLKAICSFFIDIYSDNVFNFSVLNPPGGGSFMINLRPKIDPTFSDNAEIIYVPYQLAMGGAQICYYQPRGGVATSYLIGNSYNEVIVPPDTPESGDNGSGDTGGGTVTPSGDTGGTTTPDYTEQLGNIQTGITNIENKIPTSGDITQSTITGVVQGNTSYWGSSGDLTGKEQEEYISGEISGIIEDFSGDLAKNEIFQMLDHYNEQLWGIFTGETDFKIEWQDINFMGTTLIPAGVINFTQMCRDIEILGYVKSLINIIISFHIILALVEQIYNLILSTLGIDNPYLYENGNYTEITNVNTGERIEKIYRNRRIYKK